LSVIILPTCICTSGRPYITRHRTYYLSLHCIRHYSKNNLNCFVSKYMGKHRKCHKKGECHSKRRSKTQTVKRQRDS
ncbi:hypothetical protein L9F63_012324, partial [Diploptera punctata]